MKIMTLNEYINYFHGSLRSVYFRAINEFQFIFKHQIICRPQYASFRLVFRHCHDEIDTIIKIDMLKGKAL